jgi:hypothetical protein
MHSTLPLFIYEQMKTNTVLNANKTINKLCKHQYKNIECFHVIMCSMDQIIITSNAHKVCVQGLVACYRLLLLSTLCV